MIMYDYCGCIFSCPVFLFFPFFSRENLWVFKNRPLETRRCVMKSRCAMLWRWWRTRQTRLWRDLPIVPRDPRFYRCKWFDLHHSSSIFSLFSVSESYWMFLNGVKHITAIPAVCGQWEPDCMAKDEGIEVLVFDYPDGDRFLKMSGHSIQHLSTPLGRAAEFHSGCEHLDTKFTNEKYENFSRPEGPSQPQTRTRHCAPWTPGTPAVKVATDERHSAVQGMFAIYVAFHSGGIQIHLVGSFPGKSHRSKWMRIGGSPRKPSSCKVEREYPLVTWPENRKNLRWSSLNSIVQGTCFTCFTRCRARALRFSSLTRLKKPRTLRLSSHNAGSWSPG